MRGRLSTLVLVLAAVGCARPSAPGGVVSVPEVAPERRDPLLQPWRLAWRPDDRIVYRIDVESALLSEADGRERVDSLASQLEIALSPGPAGREPDFLVRVLRYTTRVAPDAPWQTPVGVALPATLAATARQKAVPAVCVTPAPECTPELLAAAQGWQDLWLGDAPEELRPDVEWMDSTEYEVMRDSVPLRITGVRRFRVVGARLDERGRVLVELRRRSTTTLRGEGRQLGEPIRLSGRGEGEATLLVALPGGDIVSGEGRSVLRLTMEGRRRTQRLEQRSETTIAVP